MPSPAWIFFIVNASLERRVVHAPCAGTAATKIVSTYEPVGFWTWYDTYEQFMLTALISTSSQPL